MKSKDLITSHYNMKYKFESLKHSEIKKIKLIGYPRDRYEAAVHWGKGNGAALEIGAGSGEVASVLSLYYQEYIATELSIERVKRLKAIFLDRANIQIVQNDIEDLNLPFHLQYFDTIILIAVIEHLIEPISVLKYCYSLLKPGGKILIDTPNFAKWTRRLKALLGIFPSTASRDEGFLTYEGNSTDLYDEGHLHYFTFRSLKKLLKERAGFGKVI